MLKIGPDTVFDYLLNDPSTPHLSIPVPVPTPRPDINVIGFRAGPFVPQDATRRQAASVFTALTLTLEWANKIRPVKKWAAANVLTVNPRAGRDLNAYYDRFSIHLNYDQHPLTKKIVFAADSSEAVCHEFGHALLDSWRPDIWDADRFEVRSFHEAFGDVISMTSSLRHDKIIDHVMLETGGDLRKSNVVSRLAEELGNAIYCKKPHLGGPLNCLRDASLPFSYRDPDSLTDQPVYGELSREVHSFSRVFSSAWYEIFAEIYRRHGSVASARDAAIKLVLDALDHLEKTPKIFEAMASAMVAGDRGGEYTDLMKKVFLKRNMIKPPSMLC